ncbi:MAG: type III-A CRISPR-associated RAMP protein Csm5 [Bryobacteraceae bacterium]
MAVYECRLIPLTPIHVGTGETIALEDYFLANGRLTRFHPPAVLRAMSEADRKRYLALLGGGDTNMSDALKLLRQCAQKAPDAWIYSIEVGPASQQSLAEALEKIDTRRGEVHPLFWNELTRQAVLPGSAIKGAIRTALLSTAVARRLSRDSHWKQTWEQKLAAERNSKALARQAEELERELFRRKEKDLESDPFRFIKVSDAAVPADMVRLDRARLLQQGREDGAADKIQMHFERTLSASDKNPAPQLEFTLVIEKDEKAWHEGIGRYVEDVPSRDWLLQSLRFHFITRAIGEAKRFPSLYSGPWKSWMEQAKQPNCALLRLGRFSHFESLSVEGLRRTLDRRGQWITEGTSRTYCTPNGKTKMPFGWALLQLV